VAEAKATPQTPLNSRTSHQPASSGLFFMKGKTMTKVRHSDLINIRVAHEIADRVGQAAAKQYMKPSEYVRRALIDRLRADKMLADERVA
jgi:hypothetical protein